jgi:methylglutamate dehydrogenase subunit A
MATLPKSSPYVVVGAGIHGLSTAYHLAKELSARGLGSGADVVVLEKSRAGAGASGIACGVVRNNYFQPAMSELMQACVEVWESDPDAYAYNAVGYIALGPSVQEPDLAETFERQERIGYRSTFISGEAEVDRHMKELFPDWRAQDVTACLHESQGGFAFNQDSFDGLAAKAGRTTPSRRSRPTRAGSRSASSSSSLRAHGRRASGACSASRWRSTSALRPARS